MKEAHLSYLDTIFIKTKSGENNSSGSITPRTTTNKAILDQVSISSEANKTYQEQKSIKFRKVSEQLQSDLEISHIKNGLLNQLKNLENAEEQKTTENKLEKVTKDIGIIEEKQKLMGNSTQDNCDIIDFGFETIYQENINNSNEVNEDTPAVLRYGLNKERLTALVGSYIEEGLLHPYEIELFKLAIGYLNKTQSAEVYTQNVMLETPYANNAILVDIFDRSTGFINIEENRRTHTVVLWKKTNDQIMLIDPSNINFSNHLVRVFNANLSLPNIEGGTIYGTQRRETGYSEYTDLIPQPRDCVDIAVKIAFEINEQQKEGTNIEQINENVFSQISNKRKLSKHLDKIDGTFIRELQSSNKDIRREAKQFLEDETTQFIAPKMQSEMRNLISIREAYQACNTLFSKTKNIIPNTSSKKK